MFRPYFTKLIFLSCLCVLIFLIKANAQQFIDTIFTTHNDTIVCKITSIDDLEIFYTHEKRRKWRQISKDSVINYTWISQVPSDTVLSKYHVIFHNWLNKEPSDTALSISKNSIFYETLGNGFIYSINYDRIYWDHDILKTSFRIGFSKVRDSEIGGFMSLPLEQNFLIGKNNTFFEVGLGCTLVTNEYYEFISHYNYIIKRQYWAYGFIRIGARYQIDKLIVRAGFTPFLGDDFIMPWASMALGRSF